ncbi:MAG TPA: hypothetical protein VGG76_09180 [Gemmatimonadaceae bacterium]
MRSLEPGAKSDTDTDTDTDTGARRPDKARANEARDSTRDTRSARAA